MMDLGDALNSALLVTDAGMRGATAIWQQLTPAEQRAWLEQMHRDRSYFTQLLPLVLVLQLDEAVAIEKEVHG
jgi:hypothetical protein